jgi:hypothetical protein
MITGDQSKKTGLELFNLCIQTGLQPLDFEGQPLSPPDVRKCRGLRLRGADWAECGPFETFEAPFPEFDPDAYLAEVEARRGSLDSWEGFHFEGCPAALRFDREARRKEIALLASEEVFFRRGDLSRAKAGKNAAGADPHAPARKRLVAAAEEKKAEGMATVGQFILYLKGEGAYLIKDHVSRGDYSEGWVRKLVGPVFNPKRKRGAPRLLK